MTDSLSRVLYVVDANVFMDWQPRYYPTDVFPSILGKVGGLITEGRLVAPKIVEEEIDVVGTPDLVAWKDAYANLFAPLAETMAEAVAIQGRFPGLLDPKASHEEADAHVIALAKLRGGIVVTQETSATEKRNPKRPHYIPDVCRELGVSCISLLGMMRKEGWTL